MKSRSFDMNAIQFSWWRVSAKGFFQGVTCMSHNGSIKKKPQRGTFAFWLFKVNGCQIHLSVCYAIWSPHSGDNNNQPRAICRKQKCESETIHWRKFQMIGRCDERTRHLLLAGMWLWGDNVDERTVDGLKPLTGIQKNAYYCDDVASVTQYVNFPIVG